MADPKKDRAQAIAWARRMFDQRCIILDTETTGLGDDAEMVQIAIINHAGVTLFETLIKPTVPELLLEVGKGGKCAADIHGITPEHVANAPYYRDIYEDLWKVVRHRQVVIYNRDYDFGVIKHCSHLAGVAMPFLRPDAHCAMLAYAAFVGDWNDYRQSYKWQKLEGGDHSARGDCLATLKIMREMAESE